MVIVIELLINGTLIMGFVGRSGLTLLADRVVDRKRMEWMMNRQA